MPDVLVAGGGPAGLAAAIAVAERGLSVLVVDPAGGLATARGEMLPQGAAAILDRLGLSGVLVGAVRIEGIHSRWGKARLQEHGGHPGLGLHGWGIDRRALSRAMLARATGLPLRRARVSGATRAGAGWAVTLQGTDGPEVLRARYLVDATGRPARLARRLGARAIRGPGLVAILWRLPEARDRRMLIDAAPDGWWYRAPHAGGATLGFVTGPERARTIGDAPPPDCPVPAEDARAPVIRLDARSACLDLLCGPGWLATGDAAAAFDPIASQGLFNALSGGFFAGNAAADAISGDPDAPRVYQALAARTAERTFGLTHLQYAALPFDTPFWRSRARPVSEEVAT